MSTITASTFDLENVRKPIWGIGEKSFTADLGEIPIGSLDREGRAYLTSSAEEALSKLQSLEIDIPKPADVREYLHRYPDMIDLLPSVCSVTRERFGIDTRLSLEVYHDPEIDDEYLTLYVRQKHYDKQIMKTIEDIWATYDEELAERSGWLHVTTDFRPPS